MRLSFIMGLELRVVVGVEAGWGLGWARGWSLGWVRVRVGIGVKTVKNRIY